MSNEEVKLNPENETSETTETQIPEVQTENSPENPENNAVEEIKAEESVQEQSPEFEGQITNEAASDETADSIQDTPGDTEQNEEVQESAPEKKEESIDLQTETVVEQDTAETKIEHNDNKEALAEKAEETDNKEALAEKAEATDNKELVAEKAEETDKAEKKQEEEKKPTPAEEKQKHYDEVFTGLKDVHEQGNTIDVFAKSRIRGGLRVVYNDMPMFLPASHFSLKRNPLEDELTQAVGQTLQVMIHELQEDEFGRKTVIVSRKKIMEDYFWSNVNIGDIVEGVVSSIASFGVFVDIGGVEGLIHISRLSQIHVDDPKDHVKKGQKIQAVIVEADREKNRIALSRKELEESPWKGAEEAFEVGSVQKGIIRRLTDFGAYIELKPGVDGLLRTSELSWTKRIKNPSDVLTAGEEIEVKVLAVSEEKRTVTLSLKQTLPNPWNELKEKYPVGSEFAGIISQVMPQGAIVTISEEVDGFMPRSKIKSIMKGKKIPFQPGDSIDVLIADLIPEEESLILTPKVDEEMLARSESSTRQFSKKNQGQKSANSGSFTFLDLLSDEQKNDLMDLPE